MNKIFILLLVKLSMLNVSLGDLELTDIDPIKFQKALNSIPESQISDYFKDRKEKISDTKRWCCKDDKYPIITQGTRAYSFSVTKSGSYLCGQQGCGFLGWGSCSKYCIAYFAIVVYETETFTEIHDCPFELEECCKGLYLVLGQCFRKGYKNRVDEIREDPEMLAILMEQGIFLNEGRKK